MHFYDDSIKQVLGVLMAFVTTLAIKWYTDHLSRREDARIDAISIHDTVTDCKNKLDRLDDWMRGVETVGRDIIAKFEKGQPINEYDIAALKRELDQKPELGE